MKVGDLVAYKAAGLDAGVAVVVWVASNPSDSLSYKIGIVWHNGVEGEQYNWQMKVLATA